MTGCHLATLYDSVDAAVVLGKLPKHDVLKAASETMVGMMQPEVEWESSPVHVADKTEEIEQLTFPEGLPDLERANLTLKHCRQRAQIEFLISRLPSLLEAHGTKGLEVLKATAARHWEDSELHSSFLLAMAEMASTQTVLQQPSEVEWLFSSAIAQLKAKRLPDELMKAWLEVLSTAATYAGEQRIRQQILPLAVQKLMHNSSTVQTRGVCCVLLCNCARWLPQEPGIIDKALAFCQDLDAGVRLCIAGQLATLFAAVSGDAAALQLVVDEAFELARDEDVQVRKATLQSMVSSIATLPEGFQQAVLCFALGQLQHVALDCEAASKSGMDVLTVQLCLKAMGAAALREQDCGLLLSCVSTMARKSKAEARSFCAKELPRIARLAGGHRIATASDLARSLAEDAEEAIRSAVALALPDMAASAPRTNDEFRSHIKRLFLKLLQDESAAVATAAAQHAAPLLWQFAGDDAVQKSHFTSQFLPVVMALFRPRRCSWQAAEGLASAVPVMLKVLNKDEVTRELQGPLLQQLTLGCLPVRKAAAQAVAECFRATPGGRQIGELYKKLMVDLLWGPSCWGRLGFLHFCDAALRTLSPRFCKRHLWSACLELAEDRVASVRLAVAPLLPLLRGCCSAELDQALLARLDYLASLSRQLHPADGNKGAAAAFSPPPGALAAVELANVAPDDPQDPLASVDLILYLPAERAKLVQRHMSKTSQQPQQHISPQRAAKPRSGSVAGMGRSPSVPQAKLGAGGTTKVHSVLASGGGQKMPMPGGCAACLSMTESWLRTQGRVGFAGSEQLVSARSKVKLSPDLKKGSQSLAAAQLPVNSALLETPLPAPKLSLPSPGDGSGAFPRLTVLAATESAAESMRSRDARDVRAEAVGREEGLLRTVSGAHCPSGGMLTFERLLEQLSPRKAEPPGSAPFRSGGSPLHSPRTLRRSLSGKDAAGEASLANLPQRVSRALGKTKLGTGSVQPAEGPAAAQDGAPVNPSLRALRNATQGPQAVLYNTTEWAADCDSQPVRTDARHTANSAASPSQTADSVNGHMQRFDMQPTHALLGRKAAPQPVLKPRKKLH